MSDRAVIWYANTCMSWFSNRKNVRGSDKEPHFLVKQFQAVGVTVKLEGGKKNTPGTRYAV